MLSALIVAAALVAAASTASIARARADPDSVDQAATLHGRVIDYAIDKPLAHAMVSLAGADFSRSTTTGVDGVFAFPRLAAGSYLLEVRRESYDSASVSVLVPAGREVIVDVQLTRKPEVLAAVLVHAPPNANASSASPSTSSGSAADLAATLGALNTLDMRSRAGAMLAGTLGGAVPQRPPDPGGGSGHTLFVWGSEDESGQVLLDGAVIGAPLHLGGLLPSVDPQLVDRAQLRTGGAPARFDGGTGYVLELSTREPRAGSLRMWGESNLLTDRVGGEATLGESGSILAGARRVRTEMLPRLSGVMRGCSYDDLLARGSIRTSERGELRATWFGTDEALRIPRDQGSDEASWWNRAGSMVWGSGTEARRSTVMLSAARAVTDLPLLSAYGGHLRGDVNRATAAANHRWNTTESQWGVGGEIEYARFGREARVAPGSAPAGAGSDVGESGDPSCNGAVACAHAGSATAALYGDVQHRLSERLRLDAGLRVATTPSDHSAPALDALPRLALEAQLASGTSMRIAAGRYSRLGAAYTASPSAGGNTPNPGGGVPIPTLLEVNLVREHTDQIELAAGQRWGALALGVSGWLHGSEGDPPRTHLDRVVGLDASLAYAGSWFTAAASYTRIARSYHVDAATSAVTSGGIPPRSFGTEQLVSLDGTVQAGRLSLALSGSYARGVPYTSIVLDQPVAQSGGSLSSSDGSPPDANPSLARSYLRLDATLSGRWCVGGDECPVQLAPYVRVINALDRRDALFYYQDGGLDDPRSLAALPAVLSVGVRWELARTPR
jgi:hypothetical protein